MEMEILEELAHGWHVELVAEAVCLDGSVRWTLRIRRRNLHDYREHVYRGPMSTVIRRAHAGAPDDDDLARRR